MNIQIGANHTWPDERRGPGGYNRFTKVQQVQINRSTTSSQITSVSIQFEVGGKHYEMRSDGTQGWAT